MSINHPTSPPVFYLLFISRRAFHLLQVFFAIAMKRPVIVTMDAMPVRFTALIHKVFISFYFVIFNVLHV